MNFASYTFLLFLTIVVFLYHSTTKFKTRRIIIVLSSFGFYLYWYPPYILLLLASGLIDYTCSIQLAKKRERKWLIISLISNLGILFVFKYYNFFLDITFPLISLLGLGESKSSFFIDIILPMGISFYTFQSMSYTIDVYRRELKACDSIWDFFLYLSFFPQLVAGPIVRAVDFIPQIKEKLSLKFNTDDLSFILYKITKGFFLKLVIADNIARYVNYVFELPRAELNPILAWVGAVGFAIQIFCDFAGYSDIAIGVARIFGFHIKENFNNPYLARSLTNFWSRWHISLSSWFRDYLYITLGGSKKGQLRTGLNLFIVFLLSGLWHGASINFVLWGFLHATALVFEKFIISKLRIPEYLKLFSIPVTSFFVMLFWVPFRSQEFSLTTHMWKEMLFMNGLEFSFLKINTFFVFFGIFFIYQLNQLLKGNDNSLLKSRTAQIETIIYFTAVILMSGSSNDFIYFQF